MARIVNVDGYGFITKRARSLAKRPADAKVKCAAVPGQCRFRLSLGRWGDRMAV
ncbi:MAG: hypothetical protein CM1200mP34_5370 [Verrucomicrobiales bacterium]|nr:MAG: hypothetical protein CM1200mP34_5370 [Verrucomicrobiales bacterium]